MKYFICIISVYFPTLIATLRIDRAANVDELIVKILESDKFDLLANRIAERAVEKMKNLQNVSVSRTNNAEELNYHSNGQRNHSADAEDKLGDQEKYPKREPSPFDNLSLKFKKFVKNNPMVKKHKKDVTYKDTKDLNINNISDDFKPTKKRKRKNVKDTDNNNDLKKNKSKIKQSNITNNFDATKEGDGDVKQKRNKENKSISKEKVNESADNYSDDKHSEINSSKNTGEINFKSSKKGDQRKIKKKPAKLEESGKRKKSKRILRKENDRLYYLESSSDYDPYRDKIYDALQT